MAIFSFSYPFHIRPSFLMARTKRRQGEKDFGKVCFIALSIGCVRIFAINASRFAGFFTEVSTEVSLDGLYCIALFKSASRKMSRSDISAKTFCPLSELTKNKFVPWLSFIAGRTLVTLFLLSRVLQGITMIIKTYLDVFPNYASPSSLFAGGRLLCFPVIFRSGAFISSLS